MILPEHKEAILRHREESLKRTKPEPDEQAWEEYGQLLQESLQTGREITLYVYDPYQDEELSGYVTHVAGQRIRFVHGSRKTWIALVDIIKVDSTL